MKKIKKHVARLVVLAFMLSLFAVALPAGAVAPDVGAGDWQIFDVDSADSGFGGYINGNAIIKMNDSSYTYADIAKAENGKYRFDSTSFTSGTLYNSAGTSVASNEKAIIRGNFTTPVDTSVSGSSQKYTVRYPINIGAFGGSVYFAFRGGESSASTAVTNGLAINYAGAIVNGSTWLTARDFLKTNTDYIVDCVIDNSGDTTKYSIYVDGTLIGTREYDIKYTYITMVGLSLPISGSNGIITAVDYTLGDINVYSRDIYEVKPTLDDIDLTWDMSEIAKGDEYTGNTVVGGWYSTVPAGSGAQITHTFTDDGKLYYDAAVNKNIAETKNVEYSMSMSLSDSDIVENLGNGKYTWSVPVKVNNPNTEIPFGNGFEFCLYDGNITKVFGGGYKGGITDGANKWHRDNGFLKGNTDYVFNFIIDNSGEATAVTLYVDDSLIGTYTLSRKLEKVVTLRLRLRPVQGGSWHDISYEIGDIRFFTGNIYDSGTISASVNQVLIPPVGKTVNVKIASDDADADSIWSLEGAYEGITISQDGNLYVSSNASPGTLIIKHFNKYTGASRFSLPLLKISEDFERSTLDASAPGVWYAGALLDEGEGEEANRYIQGKAVYTDDSGVKQYPQARFKMPENLQGKIVIESDVRMPYEHAGNAIEIQKRNLDDTETVYDRNISFTHRNWTTGGLGCQVKYGSNTPLNLVPGEWNRLKIVADFDNSTWTMFVDDKLLTAIDAESGTKNILFISSEVEHDNFCIYTADIAAPEAYDVKISGNVAVGKTVEGSYQYYSVSDYTEYCTSTRWYVSDSADSPKESWIPVGETDSNIYTIPESSIGKYLRYVVTPGCKETGYGAEYSSVPCFIQPYIYVHSESMGVENEAQSGNVIKGANTITYTVKVTNNTDEPLIYNCYSAAYESNRMISVNLSGLKEIASGATETFTVVLDAEFETDNGEVRFYLWDSKLDPVRTPSDNTDFIK